MADKDWSLQLRKRADGTLHLNDPRGFPPRHEFSTEWLVENTLSGVVQMSEDKIVLNLANATAEYRIERSLMEGEVPDVDGEGNPTLDEDGQPKFRLAKLSTGYWGILVSSSANGEVDNG